jgi:two-component system, NarL family, invasion response regulator UvrY
MTNILLVDDHTLIRTALKIILQETVKGCRIDEATNSDSAIERIKTTSYSLVIMDVSMPNTDSLTLLNNILAIKPGTKILMFSMNPEEIYAKRYLSMGAMGYLRKDAGEEETRKAITTVLNNKRYISRELAEKLAEDSFNDAPGNPFDKLSAREFEVVQHLIRGDSVSEICRKLNLNSSTVSSHKSRVFEKLDVSNTVDIIKLAKTYNIV